MKIIDVPKPILDLLSMAAADSAAEWGTPEQLQRALLPVPSFDLNMLPDALRPWVLDIAHRMQCPIDFVAVAAVAMLGSVIGSACGIRPKQKDDWTEVPNLWGAAVGRPGRMKTPAISAAMAPVRALDRTARDEHSSAMQVHEQEKFARKLKLDLAKKAMSNAKLPPTDAELQALAALNAAQDDAPKCRRYFTNDCTFEMLGEILRDNPRGLLVLHDELTGLFDGFSRPGREGERQFYLTAWNGKDSHHVDRIGRGELYIPRLAASLFGGIQPDKLEQHLYGTQLAGGNDGFVQRFQLAVYPDEPEQSVVVDQDADEAAAAIVTNIVEVLANCDFTALGAQDLKDGKIPFFRFEAKAAQRMFFAWYASLPALIAAQDSPLMEEHLGKYRKLVPALALVFHLVDLVANSPSKKARSRGVSASALRRALAWATYLEAHARRIYAMGTDYRVQAASALAKKIEAGELSDGFTDRDIYRKEWSGLRDPDEVKAACNELEAAGWLRRIAREGRTRGRPAAPKYEINPALKIATNATPALTKPTKRRRT